MILCFVFLPYECRNSLWNAFARNYLSEKDFKYKFIRFICRFKSICHTNDTWYLFLYNTETRKKNLICEVNFNRIWIDPWLSSIFTKYEMVFKNIIMYGMRLCVRVCLSLACSQHIHTPKYSGVALLFTFFSVSCGNIWKFEQN